MNEPVTTPRPRTAPDGQLAAATRALAQAVHQLDETTSARPELTVLADAMPSCVGLAGLLAALATSLGALAKNLAIDAAAGPTLADIAVDLDTMHSLLHRATLVAAPSIADLNQLTG